MDLDDLRARVCGLVWGNLTKVEWATYVPGLPPTRPARTEIGQVDIVIGGSLLSVAYARQDPARVARPAATSSSPISSSAAYSASIPPSGR